MTVSKWLSGTLAAVSAVLLSACDATTLQQIKPGITTRAEVLARLGQPAAEYLNGDGSVTWEYNHQPNGSECHMITFGSDQVVQKVDQVLSETNFAKIREGMEKDQVQRLLGRPGAITTYERLQEEVWDWRIAGAVPFEEAHFHVHFDTGTGLVKKTSRRVEPKG